MRLFSSSSSHKKGLFVVIVDMVHHQKQKKNQNFLFSRNDDGCFLLLLLVNVFFVATKMHKLDDELPPISPKIIPNFDYDIFVPVFLVIVINVQFILDVLKNKDNLVHFPILQRLLHLSTHSGK